MAQKVALHILKSGIVLDRSEFIVQPADVMSDTITAITKEGKPLLVVENAAKFFTIANLVKMVKDQNGQYNLIAEGLDANGRFMGGAPPPAVAEGKVIRAGAGAPDPVGGYVFTDVPAGWSIGANMSLGPTKIKRKVKSPQGDGTALFMHPIEYQRLWDAASKFWSNQRQAQMNLSVACSDGRRTAYFHADKIVIAANTIRRYEMEQVAKYRGWVFPALKAA